MLFGKFLDVIDRSLRLERSKGTLDLEFGHLGHVRNQAIGPVQIHVPVLFSIDC